MVKRQSIEFVECRKPVSGLATKFGGQPIWAGPPQWPLNKATGNPMRFICQIAIDSTQLNPAMARMAYLFMTDEEGYVDGTWDPNGGENAVILQPGETTIKNATLAKGPSLYRMVKKFFNKNLVPEECEFSVSLKQGEEPDFADEPERSKWSKEQ